MFQTYKVWFLLAAFVGAFLAGASGATWVQEIRYTGIIDAQDKAALEKKLEAVAAVEVKRQKAETDLETAKITYLNNLKAVTDEYETRLVALDAGTLQLHVDAECPAPTSGVQETATGPGRNIPGFARLSDGAARRVLRLEAAIAEHKRTLGLCRDYVLVVKQQFSL